MSKRAVWCAAALAAVNLIIVAPLYRVEFVPYNNSIEYTFIAIARIMAEYPGEWGWWPFWNGGMPFENVYLPFMHWLSAGLILAAGLSAGRAFHVVIAAFYTLSAAAMFWMAYDLSRKLAASFFAAWTYSCLSFAALLVPAIGVDAGGPLGLRRLKNLVFYGEAPHTVALVLLPAAIVCISRALTTREAKWKILSGLAVGVVALTNAFGWVALALALAAWFLAYRPAPWWRALLTLGLIGLVTYCWVSPWISPRLIRATMANAPVTGGDYRYNAASWVALGAAACGYLLLWLVLRKAGAAPHLQFFALFAYWPAAFVGVWYKWQIALAPQPGRYELQMDFTLPAFAAFAAAALVERLPKAARLAVAALASVGLAAQTVHAARYGWEMIQGIDVTRHSEYKIARWLDGNRPGEKAFLGGSLSFFYNVFTDNPQFHGGHDQHAVNSLIPVISYTTYSGASQTGKDAEYTIFWLKAFGVRTIAVPGPESTEHFKPFANWRKFEGVLPVVWREGDDVIYEIPSRSSSLARVIPAGAVPARRPVHGLDTEPAEAYVAALEDPRYPPAAMGWRGMSEAVIRAEVQPGQVISAQITYEKGWEAWANGKRQRIRGDGLGQMVIEPECAGPCEIHLRYTGGYEQTLTRVLSAAAVAFALLYWRRPTRFPLSRVIRKRWMR